MAPRRIVLLLMLAVSAAYSQPDDPHAVVNGKSVSLSEIESLMGGLPPQLRGNADAVFRYYGFLERMAAKGEAAKLYEQSPYKEQLEMQRKQVLAQAEMDEFQKKIVIEDPELKDYYQKHKEEFEVATVQALLIPAKSGEEQAALGAARKAAAQWKTGAGASELLAQYPAGLTKVRRANPTLSPALRNAVFALKPGEISAPISDPKGIYVIRLESASTPEFQEARNDVWRALADAKFLAWMDDVRKSVTVSR